jgi:alpha-tubulin suppressor-like RCC1 family protein
MVASVTVAFTSILVLVSIPSAAMATSPSIPIVAATTAGHAHTCALTAAGGVKCWGNNQYGQLGDSSFIGRTVPIDVSGLSSGVSTITAGGAHTCALTTGGGVKCWGANNAGQLGDGSNTRINVPVDVSGLTSGVSAIAASNNHTCALTTGGGVKCWGANYAGQLGDGSNTSSNVPVDVSGLSSGSSAIGAGDSHTCAVTTGGGVKCWGANNAGQLGDGSNTNSNVPVDVSGLSSGVSIVTAGAEFTCAAPAGGGAKCWGNNQDGQLGDGSNTTSDVPVDVAGLSGTVSAVSAGANFTCAMTSGGGVKCWGYNQTGQLGDGSFVGSTVPVDVTGLASGVSAIDAGTFHTCALLSTGRLKCWGANFDGQLGNGSYTSSNVPVAIRWALSFVSLTASATHVHHGGKVTLSVHLTSPTFTATRNHVVHLAVTPAKQASFIVSLTVDSKGRASTTLLLVRNTSFTASYAGDKYYAPFVSATKLVGVTIQVTNHAVHYYAISHRYHLYHYERSCRLFHNRCPTFGIETSPAQTGFPIGAYVELFYGGRWKQVSSGSWKLNDEGRVTVIVPYSSKNIIGAKLRLRAVFSSWKFSTSKGAWSYFRITS